MRIQSLGLPLAIVSAIAFYLTYDSINNPPYFWSYGNYHYIWWIVPWLAFLSYLSFRQAIWVLPRSLSLAALLAPVACFLLISFKAVPVAISDASINKLQLTSSYAGQSFTVNLIVPNQSRAMDIRLEFKTPPSYPGTSVGSLSKVVVTLNGETMISPVGYMMSQNHNAVDFSFIFKGLRLEPGDRLSVVFNQTQEPKLIRASLLDVVFHLGRSFSRD